MVCFEETLGGTVSGGSPLHSTKTIPINRTNWHPVCTICKRAGRECSYNRSGKLYMVTIKRLAKEFTSNDTLVEMMKQLMAKVKMGDWSIFCIEPDSQFRNHIHVLVRCPKAPYFKTVKVKGWHLHFKEMENTHADYIRGIQYIMKHKGHLDYIREEYQIISFCHFHRLQ